MTYTEWLPVSTIIYCFFFFYLFWRLTTKHQTLFGILFAYAMAIRGRKDSEGWWTRWKIGEAGCILTTGGYVWRDEMRARWCFELTGTHSVRTSPTIRLWRYSSSRPYPGSPFFPSFCRPRVGLLVHRHPLPAASPSLGRWIWWKKTRRNFFIDSTGKLIFHSFFYSFPFPRPSVPAASAFFSQYPSSPPAHRVQTPRFFSYRTSAVVARGWAGPAGLKACDQSASLRRLVQSPIKTRPAFLLTSLFLFYLSF